MKYKICYYVIDEDSITIMFYDSLFMGQSGVPSQIYINNKDYRYGIIKSKLTAQPETEKEFDSEWFNIPAIKNIKELSVDNFGNVSYKKGAVSSNYVAKFVINNLVEYYDTPIYGYYLDILKNNGWFLTKTNESKKYYVVVPNISIPGYVFINEITNAANHNVSFESITKAPYIQSCLLKTQEIDGSLIPFDGDLEKLLVPLARENIERFDSFLEDFWKCSVSDFNKISDRVKNNSTVFEKLINKLSNYYTIDPDIIQFIAKNPTDIYKLNSLLLTGEIQLKGH